MDDFKFTLVIPTNADWNRLRPMADSLLVNTAQKKLLQVIIVDNCNTNHHDLRPFMDELRAGWSVRGGDPDDIILVKAPYRLGLTSVWHYGFSHARTDWVCIVNDDIHYEHCWDDQFRKLTRKKPNYDAFLLCHPYNWSGFAVCHRFVAEYPFRLEFPEGYYEDDDIYLRVALRNRWTRKTQVYRNEGGIYCLPFNEKTKEGQPRGLFKHVPIHTKEKSKFHNPWNEQANFAVFSKYWTQVAPGTPGGIECKDGRWWKPTAAQKGKYHR